VTPDHASICLLIPFCMGFVSLAWQWMTLSSAKNVGRENKGSHLSERDHEDEERAQLGYSGARRPRSGQRSVSRWAGYALFAECRNAPPQYMSGSGRGGVRGARDRTAWANGSYYCWAVEGQSLWLDQINDEKRRTRGLFFYDISGSRRHYHYIVLRLCRCSTSQLTVDASHRSWWWWWPEISHRGVVTQLHYDTTKSW